MNRKLLSPILLALIGVMSIVPGIPAYVAAQGSATVSVTPALSAGDVGNTFQVAIAAVGPSNVIGYDVSLTYDNSALSASSVDFDTSTVVAGKDHLNIVMLASDPIGEVRYAVTLLGGQSVDTSGSASLVIITFTVIAAQDSDLTIVSAAVVVNNNGVAEEVAVTTVNGLFLVPPVILLNAPFSSIFYTNGRAVPTTKQDVRHIHKASDQPVHLVAFIQLDPAAPRAGFGGVVFDVIDPNGVDTPVVSTIGFMFPGDTVTVTGDYFYPSVLGAYQVIVSPLRCPFPDTCVAGTSSAVGLGFKVNP